VWKFRVKSGRVKEEGEGYKKTRSKNNGPKGAVLVWSEPQGGLGLVRNVDEGGFEAKSRRIAGKGRIDRGTEINEEYKSLYGGKRRCDRW
jgi:hypothetical protein